MIMEAAKSQDLWSASWRPRRANGWYGSDLSPKAWEAAECKVQSESSSEGRRGQCVSWKQSGGEWILPFSVFCSVQSFSGLDEAQPRWGGPSALLSLLIQMLILSRNTLTDIPRITFKWTSGLSVAKASWHIKFSIMSPRVTWRGNGITGSQTHFGPLYSSAQWNGWMLMLIWHGRTLDFKVGTDPQNHLDHSCHFIGEQIKALRGCLLKITWSYRWLLSISPTFSLSYSVDFLPLTCLELFHFFLYL